MYTEILAQIDVILPQLSEFINQFNDSVHKHV